MEITENAIVLSLDLTAGSNTFYLVIDNNSNTTIRLTGKWSLMDFTVLLSEIQSDASETQNNDSDLIIASPVETISLSVDLWNGEEWYTDSRTLKPILDYFSYPSEMYDFAFRFEKESATDE